MTVVGFTDREFVLMIHAIHLLDTRWSTITNLAAGEKETYAELNKELQALRNRLVEAYGRSTEGP